MSENKTIMQQLEEIMSDVCDNYCKWPEHYNCSVYNDEAFEKLIEEKCDNCPLTLFFQERYEKQRFF